MSTKKIMIAVTAGACAISTLAAQDGTEAVSNRTPANAQKFLAVTPPVAFLVKTEDYLVTSDVSSGDACTTSMSGKRAVWTNSAWSVVPATVKMRKGTIGTLFSQGWMPGAQVADFQENSVAQRMGLRKGDIIQKINGVEAYNGPYQRALAESARTGTPVQIEYSRKGIAAAISLTAAPHPANEQVDVPGPERPPKQLKIDWSKVQQVKAAEGGGLFLVNVSAPGLGATETIGLYYPIAEVRDRVLSAAQYLKTACDRSKELGF